MTKRIASRVLVGVAVAVCLTLLRSTGALGATGVVATWTTVEKGSDESVANSAVLQADDALTFTTVSGTLYEVEATVIYASPAGGTAPDVNALFYEDATARGTCAAGRLNNANSVAAYTGSTGSGGTAADLGTETTDRIVKFSCAFTGNGGSFGLYWSQRSSGSNASVVRAGSQLRYRVASEDYVSPGVTAWVDITGKPDFTALYCDADGSEADTDCASGGSPDLSDYYTKTEVDGIAELASDTCGGPSLPPCDVQLAQDDHDALNLVWWGVWGLVGLTFLLMIAARWGGLFRVTRGM